MLIFKTLEDVQRHHFKDCRVTIGRFQGPHLGHQHLISHLGEYEAESQRVVITFDPPPEDILYGKKHPQILTMEQKINSFANLGVDVLFFIPFTEAVAQMSAERFATEYIFKPFLPRSIVVGYDFGFGKNREGNFLKLQELAPRGTSLTQVSAFKSSEEVVSTSLIRKNIISGNMERVRELLGRPFSISGTIVDGAKRGRTIGIPTMNLNIGDNLVLPQQGVYAVRVLVQGTKYIGVCNVGVNPTFVGGHGIKVECHVLDFDRDVYGEQVEIYFYSYLRAEQKFTSIDDLKKAISADIQTTRKFFLDLPNG